jgi:hypothetical protein
MAVVMIVAMAVAVAVANCYAQTEHDSKPDQDGE